MKNIFLLLILLVSCTKEEEMFVPHHKTVDEVILLIKEGMTIEPIIDTTPLPIIATKSISCMKLLSYEPNGKWKIEVSDGYVLLIEEVELRFFIEQQLLCTRYNLKRGGCGV